MTSENFNTCLQLIANGNKYALKDIYNYYHPRLLFTARLDVKNKADAEDIVSNVFMSILKNAKNYGPVECPNAWMLGSLKYAILNFRKGNSKYVYTEFIDETYYSKDFSTEFKTEINYAVSKLPKRQQEVFQLFYLYDYDIEEIANFLLVSRSTVNREIAVIKEKLKYLLER